MPKEDVYTRSRLELLAEMAMTMGGRVAEEQIFGDITTGASADIEHATRLARMMVCSFGMVDNIGPVRYGEFRNHPHSRIDAPMPDSLGNETAREIDMAIRNLVKDALETARKLLKENADELEKLAQALLEKETLDIAEINTLLGRAETSAAGDGEVIAPEEAALEEVKENADGE